jgi:hypothetical protein
LVSLLLAIVALLLHFLSRIVFCRCLPIFGLSSFLSFLFSHFAFRFIFSLSFFFSRLQLLHLSKQRRQHLSDVNLSEDGSLSASVTATPSEDNEKQVEQQETLEQQANEQVSVHIDESKDTPVHDAQPEQDQSHLSPLGEKDPFPKGVSHNLIVVPDSFDVRLFPSFSCCLFSFFFFSLMFFLSSFLSFLLFSSSEHP